MADATINIAIKTDPAQPLNQLIKQANEAEKAVDGLGSSFAKIGASIGGLAALQKTFDFILDSTRQMEDLTTQFIAFTGSAEGATDQMQKLADFAASSPFELSEVAEADRTLLAFGSTTKESLEQLRQLGEVAAATGKPIGDLATIFGQIQAEGKLTGERFNQLIERGVNIGPEIAKSLGVAQTAIRGLISDSKVSSDEVAKAFQKMTSEGGQFFGSTERLSKTVSGSLSTLKDSISLLAAEIGKQGVPAFAEYSQGLSNVIDAVRDFVSERNKIANETGDAKQIRKLGEQIDELGAKIRNLKDPGIGTKVLEGIGAINSEALLRKFSTEFKKLVDQRNVLIDKANAELAEKQKQIAKAETDEAQDKAAQKRLAKEQEAAAKEKEIQDKAAAERAQKIIETEKQITQLTLQEAAVREQLAAEQGKANNQIAIQVLTERENEITSQRLQAEATRQELLGAFDQAEILRAQDKQKKLTDANAKGAADRLALARKAQAEEFNLETQKQTAVKKFDEQTYAQRVSTAQTGLAALSSLMKSKNREAFEIGKAAATAQALVAIPVTAIEAYKSLAGIPVVGPVLGIAAAAAATAAGLENLRAIQSTKLPAFAKGGVVPGIGNKDTVPALLTPGEVVVPKKNFEDLESGFVQGAIANDQVILLRQSNDIQARILESVTFGAVIEKLTTIIVKLDQINLSQSASFPAVNTTTVEPIIAEIAQNQPQGAISPARSEKRRIESSPINVRL